MSWVFFSLLASFLWALTYFIDEHLVKRAIKDPICLVALVGAFSMFPLLFLLIKNGLPDVATTTVIIGLLSGIFGTMLLLPYLIALEKSSSAEVVPFWSIGPIFILLFAHYFLHETLLPFDYLAIIFLVISTLIATYRRGERKIENHVLFFMSIACLLYATESTLAKALYLCVPFETGFFLITLGAFITGFILFVFRKKTRTFVREIVRKKIIGLNLLNEVINFSGIAAASFAVSLGPVSLVKAVGGLQPIFILAMTAVIIKIRPNSVFKPLDRFLTVRVLCSLFFAVIGFLFIRSI